MPNLYEINRAITDCVDTETGEIIDVEMLEALFMERDAKIEGVALWIKNLVSDAAAYKAEKEAFDKREKAATKKAEDLKLWLAAALDGQKFSTAKCAVSFRRSESVNIVDAEQVPEEFRRIKTTVEPDKTAIKAALKTGVAVSGCELVEKLNTQIK